MLFDTDTRAAFGVITDLMNSSSVRGKSKDLNFSDSLEQIAIDNRLSYRPGGTKAEMVEMRQLRSRLEDFLKVEDMSERVSLINELLLSAGSIPQLATHAGDEAPHFHYTMDDATFSSKVTALTAIGLARLMAASATERFHACEGETCNKVFIDVSKNGSRRYCDSQTCGNRLHAARYRARKTLQDSEDPGTA